MFATLQPMLLPALEIVWVNVLLSGDNALVIAMACRNLGPGRRWQGMVLGAGVAVVLRVVFTLVLASLLGLPGLKLAGALALVWIAVRLVTGGDEPHEGAMPGHQSLWPAVGAIAVADVVMSLDNVLAIAAVAHGSTGLLVFGLAVSVPLIVAGAGLISAVLERLPVLVWIGGALLGWVAGTMAADDPLVSPWLEPLAARLEAAIPDQLGSTSAVLLGLMGTGIALLGAGVRRGWSARPSR